MGHYMPDELDENIQKMGAGDIDEVSNIWLMGSLTSHNFIHAGFWHSLLPELKQQWKDYLLNDGYEMYVYKEKDGTIKGFIIVKCKNQKGETINYVEELFVDSQYQRQGIGSKLLKNARGGKAFLEQTVYHLNTDAIIFYAKQGFKIKDGENSVYVEKKTGQWKLRMRWESDKKT
jgi:ribosomal protein S18 acetylase RimI-like enzyme